MTVALSRIVRTFGATRAVDDVSLEIGRGEIVALVGENGAGKTTLMRIAAGELSRDSGSVTADGRVEVVHQHFMLVNELTIAENIALGRPFRFATR
ncbi:MAG TPA: ATP-binding cassette domain-containing protein, partial [Thermoanaerobaculia bacterium]